MEENKVNSTEECSCGHCHCNEEIKEQDCCCSDHECKCEEKQDKKQEKKKKKQEKNK